MNSLVRPNFVKAFSSVIKQSNRSFAAITQPKWASFKVQDDKDFLEKVENSKEPVLVDFFAT